MNAFFLNFTKIVEANPRVYWSIIFGIAGCLLLFVAEIIHIQNMVDALNTKDQQMLREAIQPVAQKYTWARIALIVLMILWSNLEFLKTKKKLGL